MEKNTQEPQQLKVWTGANALCCVASFPFTNNFLWPHETVSIRCVLHLNWSRRSSGYFHEFRQSTHFMYSFQPLYSKEVFLFIIDLLDVCGMVLGLVLQVSQFSLLRLVITLSQMYRFSKLLGITKSLDLWFYFPINYSEDLPNWSLYYHKYEPAFTKPL